MEFRLLGPFEARHDGQPVEIGRRRQERCVLAVLLLAAGRLVTTERLVDLLWHGRPPAASRGVVQTYVGRLRSSLTPYGVHIRTVGDGYLVEADGHQVDVEEFGRLVSRAGVLTDPTERVRLLDRALALWRGPLLADSADEELRQRLHGPTEELRLVGIELRAEARLALGQHALVVSELNPLVGQFPTRERLVSTLMTALHRASRQGDALALYRTTRQRLVDDLGVEPGSRLRETHRRILRDDHPLDRPAYEVRVRDEALPWAVGGHPALDFCNTFAGWGLGTPLPGAEWLRGYRTLAVWAGYLGLVDDVEVDRLETLARREPAQAAAALDDARVLRTRLYACLTDRDERAFADVGRFAEAAARTLVFGRDADGRGRWRPDPATGLRVPLHAVAWSAAELLADLRRSTVRVCTEPTCGWLFLDETGQRRWCSLAACGRPTGAAPCAPVGRPGSAGRVSGSRRGGH
ncbi:BTAD domain-containing putative transcriptional regulator [Micromonospora sp. NPDC050397]|uniref:BTAD domain-containing putative transcriptional regulator n=1 Tax=Micromonospora sp. NPDC050397 TaxID=3364279 RepID=UPI00384D0FDC